MRRTALALCLSALTATKAAAQIYTDLQGSGASSVVLSNFHSESTPDLLVTAPVADGPRAPVVTPAAVSHAGARAWHAPRIAARRLPAAPAGIAALIDAVAAEAQVSPALLHAVVAAESAYDTRALSARGAIGLMQLLPATALRFGVRDARVAHDNLRAGASYLKWLLALFEGDLELALAAYNAGEQAVLRAGRRIPAYAETQAYVPRVLAYLACADQASCRKSQGRQDRPPRSWGVARNLRGR
jgi:soluble lytic murein transglycosylase-like protein